MSAVNLLSAFKEKPTDEGLKDGSKFEGDDEASVKAQGPIHAGGGDPAVLAVGPARRPLTYTREQLMRLRNSPLVKRGLENAFVGNEAMAPILKKRSESPNDGDRGGKGDAPNENHKSVFVNVRGERERERERRSADPRERVRKESEPSGGGIVLSPQRRSFTSGCGAPAAAPPPPHVARTRPESPLPGAAAPAAPPKPDQGRRIGSGRIMVRDMTTAPWERDRERDDGERERDREHREPYRPPPAARDREERVERVIPRNNERYERRSYNRDSYGSDIKRERDDRFNNDKNRDRDDNRRGGRYNQRRYDKEDEPEWFSGGPTSQLETIELRGFDEPMKRNGTTNSKDNEKWSGGNRSPTERWREPAEPAPAAAPPAAPAPAPAPAAHEKDSGVECKSNEESQTPGDQADFDVFADFDDFLKYVTIPDILTNGGTEAESGGSRFSRWFQRSDSPTHHYEKLLHNLVDDFDSTERSGPAHVFAPIAPAAPPAPAPAPAPAPPAPAHAPSLLDLLRRANAANDRHAHQDNMNSVGGKMHSLEELEARLRPQHPAPAPLPDHDLTAFKQLLAQVSGGHAVPAAAEPQQRQPMSLLQMLNKSVEQQQQQKVQQQQQQQQQQQPHIPQELLYKLLHVQRQQQEMQGAMPSGINSGQAAAERDLLQRPEAIALIQGLKAGEITVQHLMQQLSNPGLQSRHRDLLHAILRMHHHHRQMGGSPLPSGVGGVPAAPHLVVPPPHHQPLRLSPIPHPAFCVSPILATSPNTLTVHHPGVPARIPSPRELVAHTQSIMQGALIKKKLEEQRENYRRRHEMQHQPKQPTPISFTPTSVLRKMTAEKESDAPSPKQQQWNQPPKMPQGRPIVKGNQSGALPPMGYNPSPVDYQQHYMNQQQQMTSGRSFPHPQQRQQVPPTLNQLNNVNMSRGVAGTTTLHQLLVQSHQRSINEMGGGAGGSGGGDNQLARWFSPELLARASAGKLPSVHVPNALSLEELERAHHSPAVRN